jgi:hypothetical protein
MRSASSWSVAVGREVEQQPAGGDGRGHHEEHARQHRRRQLHARLARPLRRRLALGRRHAQEDHAERDAHEPGHDEGRAPAEGLDQVAGEQRRRRDAEVAREAVDADRRPRVLRLPHQHRDAHRVVDRCERAEQRERRCHLPGVLRQRDEDRRRADAEEEHQHHAPPAPQVAQPPRGQRAEAEQREGAHAVGDQVLPARKSEVGRDRRHRGREGQQEQVVQRMGRVEQQLERASHHPGNGS